MGLGLQSFFASIATAGLAGLIGAFFALLFIGGSREASVWDTLTLVQWGGLPAAAAAFWLCARLLLLRNLSLFVVAPLFVAAQVSLPPFFRQVVRSDLTGNQGAIIVVITLILVAAAVTWLAPATSSQTPIARTVKMDRVE